MAEQSAAKAVNTKKYFKDTVAELKKVIWPTRKELTNSTIMVIVSILIIGMFIWVFDGGIQYILETWVFKK